jgi:hypothetical protein
MDAQQELFTSLKLAIEEKELTVYEGNLPPSKATFPFVLMADTSQTDRATKSRSVYLSSVTQNIHIWHNESTKRGSFSRILDDIKEVCRNLEWTNTRFSLRSLDLKILADNSTSEPLMHGIIIVNYYSS